MKDSSLPVARTGASDPSTMRIVGLGLLLSLPLVLVSGLPFKLAVLAIAGLAAASGLVLLGATAARLVPTVLYVAFLALASVPVDKYFLYREHVGGWPGIRISAADLFVLALIPIGCLAWVAGTKRNRLPIAVIAIYGVVLSQYLVSALAAPDRNLAFFEIASATHALILALVCAAFFERRFIVPILLILSAQVLLHTTFATIQVATGRPIGVGLGGGPADVVVESLETGAALLRPSGLFDHPIVFANFLMIALPLLTAGPFMTRSRSLRGLLVLSALVAALGLGLTLSRGAWISTAVTMTVLAWLAWRNALLNRRQVRALIVGGLVATVLVGAVLGPRIYERVTASRAGNLEVRFELNKIAMRMIAAHPLTGVGLNNFIPTMAAYDPDDVMSYFPAVVHNLYLLEAAEAGLPALMAVLALMIAIYIAARRRLPGRGDPVGSWFAIAILAGLCGFAFSQLADFSHRIEPLRTVLWTNIGLLFGVLATRPDPNPNLPKGDQNASN